MSGGYSKKPDVHDSAGNPQRTITQGDYEKARMENEARIEHRAAFPTKRAQLMHIFRKSRGHFSKDTKENRNLIISVIEDENYYGTDMFNQRNYYKIISNGKNAGCQVWAYVREGVITNAGLNDQPISEDEIKRKVNRK